MEAAEQLLNDGVFARVLNCVSPGLVHRKWQQRIHRSMLEMAPVVRHNRLPVVTVIDGHPSALSWVGSMLGVAAYPLGVTEFGQSGLPDELHHHFQIDPEAISFAVFAALGGTGAERR
jgi:pyruvate dehydrogenase complex dehydrogenase (E1) component